MTNLTKLSVSLTKHGSHKIANLLDLSDPNTILSQTVGVFPGINIDAAQARKILSASTDHGVPAVWHEAKNSGRATINGLIMLAIIFSHVQLIKLFTRTTINFGRGNRAAPRKCGTHLAARTFSPGGRRWPPAAAG